MWTHRPPRGTPIDTSSPYARGLILSMLFNEGTGDKVSDQSGNGNDGRCTSGAWGPGRDGPVLDFPPTTIIVPYRPMLDVKNITMSVWINPDAQNANDYIMSRWDSLAALDYAYTIGITDQAGKKLKYSVTTSGGVQQEIPSFAFTLGTWYHYVVTYDGINLASYINGGLVSSDAVAVGGDIDSSAEPLLIGLLDDSVWGAFYFDGQIYYPQIWNRALTALEISYIYSNPYAMYKYPTARPWMRLKAGNPYWYYKMQKMRRSA